MLTCLRERENVAERNDISRRRIPRRATGPILGTPPPIPEMHSTEDVGFQPRVRHPGGKNHGKGVCPGSRNAAVPLLSWLGRAFSYGK